MNLRCLIVAGLLCAAPLRAQETASTEPSGDQAATEIATAFVPIVGSIDGANDVHWSTDVELVNDFPREVTVSLSLPTVADEPTIITTIPANDRIRFHDVFAEAFGLDRGISPLVVHTLDRRSVTVNATVYPLRGTETIPPQPVAVEYDTRHAASRSLKGLSFNDAYRTNIGLVNLSDKRADFLIALQRLEGRNLAVTRMTLEPNSLAHMPIQIAFPLISDGDNFTVVVESSSPDTWVYASVIENATSAARFVRAGVAPQ